MATIREGSPEPRPAKAWSAPLLFCLLAFLVSRLVVLGAAYAVFYSAPEPPAPPGYRETQGPLDRRPLNVLFFYDAVHYLRIAREGYTLPETPWYPLYPMLVKAGGGTAASAVGISNFCFFLGLLALFRLGGRRAVVLACASPIGIVFSAAYSESLFFCLAAWFLLFCREGKELYAGLLAGLAALSRSPGWCLAGGLCHLLLVKRPPRKEWTVALALALAVGVSFPLFLYIKFGSLNINAVISGLVFSRCFRFFWWGTLRDLSGILTGIYPAGMDPFVLISLSGWIWLVCSLAYREGFVPGILYALFVLSFPITNPGYVHATHGLLRYACAWPGAYLGMGRLCTGRRWLLLVFASWLYALLIAVLVAQKAFIF